ncbi:hypothetical protein ACFFX0_23420 [Citricoccus parietis]|uniref:Uncharacterized protein n=1 Tax=Citricoccus parietis TaxID=592307 RepID=A0ABV5G4V9_9MICC
MHPSKRAKTYPSGLGRPAQSGGIPTGFRRDPRTGRSSCCRTEPQRLTYFSSDTSGRLYERVALSFGFN